MTVPSDPRRHFPTSFTFGGKPLVFRPLSPDGRDAILDFACGLPREDLLFLDRDITQPAVVDAWVRYVSEGKLVTIVAWSLFQRLGFEQEAILRDHAMDTNGVTHDLMVLSFQTRYHPDHRCGTCGVSVLAPVVMEGVQLCSLCYELRYEELGSGD